MKIDFTGVANSILTEYGLAIFILCVVAAGLGFLFFMRYKSDIKMREKEQEDRNAYQGALVRQQETMAAAHAENGRISQAALLEATRLMKNMSDTMVRLDNDITEFIKGSILSTAQTTMAVQEITKDLPKHATECSVLNHNIKDILVEIRTDIKTCKELLIAKK